MGDYPGSSDIDNLNQPPSGIPTISTGSYWDAGQGKWIYPGDPSYDANKANKGSSAGGGALPIGASTTTPATTTATTAGNVATKGADYAGIINAIIGAYGAIKGNKFHNAPDPLNDALRARIYGFIDKSPTRDMLGTALGDYVKAGANSNWTPPPSKYGYNPYPNGVPNYDLSNLMPMLGQKQPVQGGGVGNDPSSPQQENNLSAGDAAKFQAFAQQYGQPAAHQVIAILERNPSLGVNGAIASYQSQVG